jgi:hypothetical protein
MTIRKKVLSSALVVAALGSVTALGVFGLFSATTQNSGNEISSGTVALTDNDAGSAQINTTGAKPGDSWTRCIKVTYNGSLPADVHSYTVGGTGPLASYLHLTLTQGTQASPVFPSCTGFTADATNGTGVTYDGPALSGLSTDYATGSPVLPFGQTSWNPGDSLVFRSVVTLDPAAPDVAQGNTSGVFSIFWEARNHA